MSPSIERRLAAILAADVVGYSRLMGIDEVGTLAAVKAARAELIEPVLRANHGRLVKTTGDGFLIEFASVVDAISCAVAMQKGMLARNAAVPPEKHLIFRVGVNIGDIIIDGQDIFGDGVNVAARLESLCEPGGICISRAANEQIRDKLHLSFADMGEHSVKNIARAIGVFGLSAQDIATLPEAENENKIEERARRHILASIIPSSLGGRILLAVAAGLAVLAAGEVWMFFQLRGPSPQQGNSTDKLISLLERGAPAESSQSRKESAAAYFRLSVHRAMAIAPRARSHWRTGDWPSRQSAEEKVLEKCSQFYDEPCAVIAVDD